MAPADATAGAATPAGGADAAATTGGDKTTVQAATDKANEVSNQAIDLVNKYVPFPGLSVAMRAVLMLVFLFFIVMTLIKVIETKQEFMAARNNAAAAEAAAEEEAGGPVTGYGQISESGKQAVSMLTGFFSLQSMNAMAHSMDLVPMICVLIIFARLQAVTDLHTDPQPYARGAFLAAGIAVYVQAFAVVIFPKSGTGVCYWIGKVTDWLSTLMLYTCIIVIIASICTLKSCEYTGENKGFQYWCALEKKDLTSHLASMKDAAPAL